MLQLNVMDFFFLNLSHEQRYQVKHNDVIVSSQGLVFLLSVFYGKGV